jgi:hypothetical protein
MTANIDANILNLVQHVELNKIGWWDSVIQRLILATLWMDGKVDSMSVDDLVRALKSHFDLDLGIRINSVLEQISSTGNILKLSDGRIKLSEVCLKSINSDVHEAEEIIERAKKAFIDTLTCNELTSAEKEQIWVDFNDSFLRPFIRNIGANIYELLNVRSANLDQSLLDTFLDHYRPEQRDYLFNSAQLFLTSMDQNVRSYILRSLNTHFCVEACGLDQKTIRSLQNSISQAKTVTLFIDTNFLFSILELHENPSNAAALGLIEIIKNLSKGLNIKLFVTNPTLDEARAVLRGTIDSLNGSRITPNMAEVAGRYVSGLSRKFFYEVNRSNTPLTPKQFFQPYIDNLVLILRTKGVEVFNEDITQLNTRQDVVDDLITQTEYEEKKWGDRAKAYKPLEHDIVLWHLIKDKRKIGVDSPLDAEYWIVTIDFRFLGFDDYKKANNFIIVPICIHPTTLVQMLQFWIPRSQLLEDTLYSSLWLPFVFRDLDPQSENITIEIIKTLGRFENIGDLPKETIIGILVNEALRQRIKNETNVEKQIELVREALIEQNQRAQAQIDEEKNKNKGYEQILQEKDADINKLRDDLQFTQAELAQEREERKGLSNELASIRQTLDRRDKEEDKKRAQQKFINIGLVIPFVLLLLIWFIISTKFVNLILYAGIFTGGFLVVWSWLFDYFGEKNKYVSDTRSFKVYHSLIKWIPSILGVILIGIMTNALYDWLKIAFMQFFEQQKP